MSASNTPWLSQSESAPSLPKVVLHGNENSCRIAAACFTFPANALLKVTYLLSHLHVQAKEIFCYSLVFRITAFQMLLRR